MQYFDYKTKNHVNGKIFRGIITADDIQSAEETLKRRGEDIIELDYIKDFLNIRKSLYNISSKPRKKVIPEFLTMIKFMLESGVSLHEALVMIRDSGINKQLRNMTRVIADEVRKGLSLSVAIKKTGYFDDTIVQQIGAGEESGKIIETITRIIKQLERDMEFKSKIKSSMMYPIIICVVMIAVLWVMLTLVVPSLADTLVSMGGELPMITKIVIAVSTAMKTAAPFIILVVIALVITYRILMKNPSIKIIVDKYKRKIPLAGTLIEKIELSKFSRNLSAMLECGITLVSSLKIVNSCIKNLHLREQTEKATRLIELSGMNLSTALAKSGSFPSMMLQLIEVGINSGQICDVLEKISDQYETEADTLLKRIASLAEPLMIVFVGIVVGVLVISMFLPMFALTDNF